MEKKPRSWHNSVEMSPLIINEYVVFLVGGKKVSSFPRGSVLFWDNETQQNATIEDCHDNYINNVSTVLGISPTRVLG